MACRDETIEIGELQAPGGKRMAAVRLSKGTSIMSVNARSAALKALAACRRSGAWSDETLNSIIMRQRLNARDASLAVRICYGVLQNTALIDYYLSVYSSVKPGKMEPLRA